MLAITPGGGRGERAGRSLAADTDFLLLFARLTASASGIAVRSVIV